jgi:dTDP-4-dehydrorhamnose 3,5-epimerase
MTTMTVRATEIPDVLIITPARHGDARGFLSETYNKQRFAAHGIGIDFVQDNHSFSAAQGTVRGLHFQTPPFAQAKLVRVLRGAIYDVAVDLRASSPTFGRSVGVVLSAEDWNQLLIPVGFAHGFCTLTPDTDILYKVSQHYSPEHDKGVLWNDPDLGIDWPVEEDAAILSEKDRRLPRLRELPSYFD